MKRTFICIAVAVLLGVTWLFGQSIITSGGRRWTRYQTYDSKTVPPMSLSEAYGHALTRLGDATNRFHCLSASCTEMGTSNGFTGWTFWFSNTNGDRAKMWVFFDGGVTTDMKSSDTFRRGQR